MPTCFVPACRSGYRGSKGKHFFRPPKNEAEFSKWVRAIPRKDKDLTHNCFVCDSHFGEELITKADLFIIDGKEVEIPRQRWALKPGAVPHLFPSLPKYLSKVLHKRKSPVKHLQKRSCGTEEVAMSVTVPSVAENIRNERVPDAAVIALKRKLKCKKLEVMRLRNKLRTANAEINTLRKQLSEEKRKTAQLNLVDNCKLSKKQKIIVDTMLKKCQLKNNKGMRYDNEFLLDSVLLKIKSPKGYRHCLKHGLLPLPSETHLRNLLKGLKCSYGINAHAVEAIKNYFRDELDENKRLGVLIFDEVKLQEELQFNNTSLKVDGFVNLGEHTPDDCKNKLANHALVFMLVPLLHSWIQPVAVYASRNATPGDIVSQILIQVIIQLEQAGIKIIAFICDGSQPNKKVWQCLGISGTKNKVTCSISNPVDETRRIWVFSDAMHVIKCVRNHFSDKTNVLFNDEVINYNFYRQLYQQDSSPEFAGLKVCHKLTSSHLNPSSFQRMNVRLALQLFSNSVANGIKFFREIGAIGFEGSESTESFTREMNNLVDALNSSLPNGALYKNSEAHKTLVKWKSILADKSNSFASERTIQSLRVTIESTLGISEYLWKRGFSYILTAKFNQDPLERHFGIVRSLSCNDHPSVIDFLSLHMLQCIYIPVKLSLSSGGNCEHKSEFTLTSYVSQMRTLAKHMQQKNSERVLELENLIKKTLSVPHDFAEAQSDPQRMPQNLEESNTEKECLVYHLAGYVVHQARRVTKCQQCLSLLSGNMSDMPCSLLTSIRDYGSSTGKTLLTYPSKGVFKVLMEVENIVAAKLRADSLWGDIFYDCLNSLGIISVEITNVGCCEDHMMDIVPKLIFHYMKCRFFTGVKQFRKELKSSKTSKTARKLSKLADN